MVKHNDDAAVAESEDLVPLMVRVDKPTMAALKSWARENDRSLAAQVRTALKATIPGKHFGGNGHGA